MGALQLTTTVEDQEALDWLADFQATGGTFHWWDKPEGVLWFGVPQHPAEAVDPSAAVMRRLDMPLRPTIVRLVKADPARWGL